MGICTSSQSKAALSLSSGSSLSSTLTKSVDKKSSAALAVSTQMSLSMKDVKGFRKTEERLDQRYEVIQTIGQGKAKKMLTNSVCARLLR